MTSINKKKISVLNTQKEFDCVLNQHTQIKNSYFVLHYYINDLSTEEQIKNVSVDNCLLKEARLGLIIPKRFAKNAVTRSMIKRQCRHLFSTHVHSLPKGAWIIRLKRPIDRTLWKSCTSLGLKSLIQLQLQDLFQRASKQFNLLHPSKEKNS